MARFVAFLRGVSPMNLKMGDLKGCLETAGFTGVRTLLSSGNVAFDAARTTEAALARRIEAQLQKELGRTFPVTVRSTAYLGKLLAADPYRAYRLPAGTKRIITFLWNPPGKVSGLPLERDGARILAVSGSEAFSAYTPSPRGPVFMKLIQDTFGIEQTTRTWDTVQKCAAV